MFWNLSIDILMNEFISFLLSCTQWPCIDFIAEVFVDMLQFQTYFVDLDWQFKTITIQSPLKQILFSFKSILQRNNAGSQIFLTIISIRADYRKAGFFRFLKGLKLRVCIRLDFLVPRNLQKLRLSFFAPKLACANSDTISQACQAYRIAAESCRVT